MTFIPDLNVLLAYTAAAVILVITPGPDMTLFLGQTLTGGRAYLLWLAFDALRRGAALTLAPDAANPQPLGRVFLMGVAINLLNPKIVMFFLTFLPQFVSASDPHAGGKLMFLGLYFIVLAIPICFALILAADRFTDTIRRSS